MVAVVFALIAQAENPAEIIVESTEELRVGFVDVLIAAGGVAVLLVGIAVGMKIFMHFAKLPWRDYDPETGEDYR